MPAAGAYLEGAIGPCPPLCNLGRRFEHRDSGRRTFLAKNLTKFKWKPFFWSSPNFGQKTELNLIEDIFGGATGGFRGGMRGMHLPHQPKSNDFGRKISLYFEKLGSISGCIPPTSVKLTVSARLFFFFFFFFFLETTWFWAEKRSNFRFRPKNHSQFRWRPFFFWRPPDFGWKKRSNFRFRPKYHSQFLWRHPNFWGFVLKIPPHQNFLDPPLGELHLSLIRKTNLVLGWEFSRL